MSFDAILAMISRAIAKLMNTCDNKEPPHYTMLDIRLLLLLTPLALFLFQETIIVPLDGFRARMLWSKGSCKDGQRSLVERLRLRVLALAVGELRQVVQAYCRVGMICPHLLLAHG